jgi:hypothetical protein
VEWQQDKRKILQQMIASHEFWIRMGRITVRFVTLQRCYFSLGMGRIQLERQLLLHLTPLYSSGTTNLLSYILRGQFKTHQEYLDFWYAELIDKIGMHSMVIEADMAGNYVALLTVGQRHAIGQNSVVLAQRKLEWEQILEELGEICCNSTTSEGCLWGAVLVKRRW